MSYTLEGHAHRGSMINYAVRFDCDVCDRSNEYGYSCDECKFNIHAKCAFVFNAKEIWDHPSHDGHCLKLLTTGAPDHTDPICHLSDKKTKRLLYHCSDCKLNLDVIDAMCARRSHLNMPWHPHPLLIVDITSRMICHICGDGGEHGYLCPRCRLVVHESCISQFVSQDITHLSHVRHPLKPITDGALDYTDGSCHLCGEDAENLLYHCDICVFNLDLECAIKKPPPVALSNVKVHEHTLTLMPRLISFVCDACGTIGDRSPYVCVKCDFLMFHQECAQLPRVIHVNHHEHRVSYKYPLGSGPGEWICGVCWKEIIWSYGAYSCSICPRYAIHSLCATRKDVWDGKDLDGMLEEVEDIEP